MRSPYLKGLINLNSGDTAASAFLKLTKHTLNPFTFERLFHRNKYIYIHIYIPTYTHIHSYKYIYRYSVSMYAYIRIYILVCKRVYKHICM